MDAYWKWRLEQNPEYATRTGSDIDADKWQSLTEDAFRQDMVSTDVILMSVRQHLATLTSIYI